MVLPWELIGTAVTALAVGYAVLRWRARDVGADARAASDLAFDIGLFALVAARLVRYAFDLGSAGTAALDLRALLTLGSGLSTPGAVLGGLLGGVWVLRRRRSEDTSTSESPPAAAQDAAWRALVPAAAAGLAAWSALAPFRGELLGVAGIPVALLEAAALAAVAVWTARTSRFAGPRLGAAFAAAVAAIHLAASLLRPSLPVLDTDVEIILGVAGLVLALLIARGTSARRLLAAGVGGALVVGGLGALAVVEGSGRAPAVTPIAAEGDLLAGALTTASLHTTAPAFGPAEFAAFVTAADGRPVVVNFWASWCPPCRAEAPALARSARALGERVAFLGVNVDDDPRRAAGFVDRYDLPFPSVRDAGLSRHLGMRGLPTTIVLHGDGTIAAHMVGGVDPGSLAAAVARAGG